MSVAPRAAALLLAGLLGLTACGGGSGSSATATKPSQPTTNGIEKLDADAILAKATAAAHAASAVHVRGKVVDGSDSIELDLRYVADKGAVGTLTNHGQSVQILRVGTNAYLKGDKAFWTSVANAQVAELVADKYVKGSTSDANFKDFVDFTDLDSLLDNLKPDSTISKVAGKPVGGVATVGLLDSDKSNGGTLYVANVGTPYPLLLEPVTANTTGESMQFDEWDKPTTLTTPAAAEVIDIAKLGG
jgi:hypothetical protein